MSESLVEEKNVVEEFKGVRWADLEDEEQSSRREQMTEKKEVMNRSEALTHVADGQKDRGEEKERQTENDDNETWQGEASGGRRRQRDTARRSATAKGRHEEDMSQTSWFGQKKSTIQADTRTSVPQTCAQNVKNRSLMAVTVLT